MKIVITESQLNFILESNSESDLNELIQTPHFIKRIKERWLDSDALQVILTERTPKGFINEFVGYYPIPLSLKIKIREIVDFLKEHDIPEDINLGLIVHRFDMYDFSKFHFKDEHTSYYVNEKLKNNRYTGLFMQDREGGSRGDTLLFVIKENRLITTYFGREYGLTPEKLGVDEIIDDIEDFKNYIKQ